MKKRLFIFLSIILVLLSSCNYKIYEKNPDKIKYEVVKDCVLGYGNYNYRDIIEEQYMLEWIVDYQLLPSKYREHDKENEFFKTYSLVLFNYDDSSIENNTFIESYTIEDRIITINLKTSSYGKIEEEVSCVYMLEIEKRYLKNIKEIYIYANGIECPKYPKQK